MSKCFFFAAFNFCETGVTILSVGETNFWVLKVGHSVNPVVSADANWVNVLLPGHPLVEESPCTEACLTIVVPEWDRGLCRVVQRLDLQSRVFWSGCGGHGR